MGFLMLMKAAASCRTPKLRLEVIEMNRIVAFLIVFSLAICGIQTTAAIAQEAAPATAPGADYVIGKEDVMAINVWKDAELSIKDVVVRPDGKISLPLVGDVQADGLTVKQLQDTITDKLKEYVTAPVVTVTVTKIFSKSVSIVGQVGKPGIYTIGSPMTVIELLARAGGPTIDAKTKKIKIFRKEGGKILTFLFNYNDIASGKNLSQNILLKSGDEIVVP
jgi:polysaccharide biosynthesis/export protein